MNPFKPCTKNSGGFVPEVWTGVSIHQFRTMSCLAAQARRSFRISLYCLAIPWRFGNRPAILVGRLFTPASSGTDTATYRRRPEELPMLEQPSSDPSAALFDLIASQRITAAIYAAARLGIADLISDGARTPGELAKR